MKWEPHCNDCKFKSNFEWEMIEHCQKKNHYWSA